MIPQRNQTCTATLLMLAASLFSIDAEKPNITLILTDALEFNQIGAYGDTPIKPPNLDRLANNGIRFTLA